MSIRNEGAAVLKKGTPDQVFGYCTDMELGPAADEEKIKNGDGQTASLLYSDDRKEFTGNFTPTVMAGNGTHPAVAEDIIGSLLEIKLSETASDVVKIRVATAKLKLTQGKAATWAVTGAYYPAIDGTGGTATPPSGS